MLEINRAPAATGAQSTTSTTDETVPQAAGAVKANLRHLNASSRIAAAREELQIGEGAWAADAILHDLELDLLELEGRAA
jgi:hypothetical protein